MLILIFVGPIRYSGFLCFGRFLKNSWIAGTGNLIHMWNNPPKNTADVDAAWSLGGNQPFPECSILKAKNDHWDHPHVNQGDRFLIPEIKKLSPWFLQKSLEKRICYGHRWQRYLTWGWRTHVKYKCLMDEHDFSLRKCAVAMIFAFRRGFYGIIFPSWRQKTCRNRRQYKIIQ